MRFILQILKIFIIYSFVFSTHAAKSKNSFSRDFWSPKYHGQRLNYCKIDNKTCGLAVANEYCNLMGYKDAKHMVIANNIGLTNFISSQAKCKGWRCNGFKLISCQSDISHTPPEQYYYRYNRYSLPRFKNFRLAWCYKGQEECGQRAAYSFCREMGYKKESTYKMQPHVPATKNIGDQKLCYGNNCQGFESITCFR